MSIDVRGGLSFASHDSGACWVESHPDTTLLSLDETFALARRQNARLFGAELERCRARCG